MAQKFNGFNGFGFRNPILRRNWSTEQNSLSYLKSGSEKTCGVVVQWVGHVGLPTKLTGLIPGRSAVTD